jgi:1-acyl-sn-glycerol-3-phosphate acyltransferase
LALESGAAIAPITIRGTYQLMPRGAIFARRGKIDVLFHPPVPTAGYDQNTLQALVHKVKDTIVSGLPA